MLFSTTLVLSLLTSAFAIPTTSNEHAALKVTRAFQSQLSKRQSGTQTAINSLEGLLTKAVNGEGNCGSQCSGWVSEVTKCTNLGSYTQIGICACGDAPLNAMNTCGSCYGGSSVTDASNFASFCKENLGTISSYSSRFASATSSGSSVASSAVAGAASSASAGTSNPTSTSNGSAPSSAASGSSGSGSGAGPSLKSAAKGTVLGAGIVALMLAA
ncbi:uncharacterized protein JCM15063_004281 [Sporobolomyces koalae]|uniref:uncharacterized protein n=1 Tax=Sporobolomyces koalae TaxID=500713 RepID=UPI00317447DC